MEWQFSRLESAIEAQPMPEEFRDTKALIYCNDCLAKTSVRYHWLGLKCAVCDSYNTAQLQILAGPDPAGADYAEAPPAAGGIPAGTPPVIALSRPHSPNRGRARHHYHHQPTQPRAGTSAPPSAAAASLMNHLPPNSRTHSAAPGNPTATTFPFSLSPSPPDTDNESSDADDSMEEYDEVDFWGGESPSARKTSPLLSRGRGASEDHEMVVDEEGEDADDSEDDFVRESEDEEEDDDDEEEDGAMELDLIGHR